MRTGRYGDKKLLDRIVTYNAGLPREYDFSFLKSNDLDSILELERMVFPRPIRKDATAIRSWFSDDSTLGFLATKEDNGTKKPIGEIVIAYDDSFDDIEKLSVGSLAVLPGDTESEKIKEALLKLGTIYTNFTCFYILAFPAWERHNGINVAKRLGFKETDRKDSVYSNGDSQIILEKDALFKDIANYLKDLTGDEWFENYMNDVEVDEEG